MTIRHLKIFIDVANSKSMREAAAKNFISQPTVSQTIKELEEHYGVLLFERIARRLYITQAGKKLLSDAVIAVKDFENLEENMLTEGKKKKIRIGATITVGSCFLSTVLNELYAKLPQAETYAYMNNTRNIEEKLLRGELDLAIVEGKIKNPDLVSLPVITDYLVLICGKYHPLYGKEMISVSELENYPFVVREEGSGTRELFEDYIHKYGLKIKIGWEVNCPGAIKEAVIKTGCLAVISVRLVEEEIKNGQVYVIESEEGAWNRFFSLVFYKNKIMDSTMNTMLEIVENHKNTNILKNRKTGILSV